jgi:hypothetical protein
LIEHIDAEARRGGRQRRAGDAEAAALTIIDRR